MAVFVSCIAVWILTTANPTIIVRHDRPETQSLQLGAKYPAACRILPDGMGALIAPQWVLTAAHVAAGLPKDKGKVRFGDKEYEVARVVLHPEGTPKKDAPNQPPEVDLALVELKEPVKDVSPMPIYRARDELGKTIKLVGCGDIGNGKDAPKRSDGKPRGATNIVDDAGPKRLFMKFDEPPTGTDLEGASGPGDSGGPAIIEVEGKPFVCGVSSGAMDGKPGRYGLTDVYTRVSTYADWIEQAMRPASKATPGK